MLKKPIGIIKKFPDVILLLMLGMYSGSMVTLSYIKRYDISTLTYGDLGGMLAGVSTLGLFFVAIKTANTWKEQSSLQNKINSLDNASLKVETYYRQSDRILMLLADHTANESSIKGTGSSIKDPTIYIKELDKLFGLVTDVDASIIRLNAIWAIEFKSSLIPSAATMYRLSDSLKNRQSIFYTHNKAMTTNAQHKETLREEISNLYSQLNL